MLPGQRSIVLTCHQNQKRNVHFRDYFTVTNAKDQLNINFEMFVNRHHNLLNLKQVYDFYHNFNIDF